MELVVEPVVKPVVEPVKMKTRKPRQPKQRNPLSKDDTPVVVPDIEDLVLKRMQYMRDAKELKKSNQALLAQGISIVCSYI